MGPSTQQRLRALVMVLASLLLLVGVVYRPYIEDYTDFAATAGKVADDPDRWLWSSIILVLGVALLALSAVTVRRLLAQASEDRWSFAALPLVVIGTIALAACTGLDASLGIVANAGGDVEATIDAGEPWVNGGYGAAVILSGHGSLGFAIGTYRSELLPRNQSLVAIVGFVLLAVSMLIPFGWATYGYVVGSALALWPLALHVWQQAEASSTGVMGAAPA